MTHTYITTIEQPTLHYLTRSVRRRAATSKRAYIDQWGQTDFWWATPRLTERAPLHSSSATHLLEKNWLSRSVGGIVKIAQPDANQAKTLLWT